VLPVPYFHVVFTLPHALNPLLRVNPRQLYTVLFRTAVATLQHFARDPKHLGAELEITAVLHTWAQNLTQHVHLHCVVTGGGLTREDQGWKGLPQRHHWFLFPVRALAKVFRAKFRDGLQQLRADGELKFAGQCAPLAHRPEWARWLHCLSSIPWVVYAKPPFGGPQHVLKYLSRYTHRVAITNQRILYVGDGLVRFRWKDYTENNAAKLMTLSAQEFLRRFLLHVMPKGFMRIRHFGLLATRCRAQKLARCRDLLAPHASTKPIAVSQQPLSPSTHDTASRTSPRCPACGSPHLRLIERFSPVRGIPP